MEINLNTKFDIGDMVYIAERYYDYYASKNPCTVIGISINISNNNTKIMYNLSQNDLTYLMPEDLVFTNHKECAEWCKERNQHNA